MQLLVNSQFAFQLCSAFTPSYLHKEDTDMGATAALTHTEGLSRHVQQVAESYLLYLAKFQQCTRTLASHAER